MLKMCRHVCGSGKAVVLESEFCVAKGLIELEANGVYAAALIKKRHYWTTGGPGDLIDTHFDDKEVGDLGMIMAITEDNTMFKTEFSEIGVQIKTIDRRVHTQRVHT